MSRRLPSLCLALVCATAALGPEPAARGDEPGVSLFSGPGAAGELTPRKQNEADRPHELGLYFVVKRPGRVTAIRYFRPPGEEGEHAGRLWTHDGRELAVAKFVDETAEGWQEARLAEPLTLTPNVKYVVSVNQNKAIAFSCGMFAKLMKYGEGYDNGPLSSWRPESLCDCSWDCQDQVKANGPFSDSPGKLFPIVGGENSNFFRDVVFVPEGPADAPIALFNGQNLDGWHIDCPKLDDDAQSRAPFTVRDGLLVSLGTPEGHLLTEGEYGNYRLEVEYRFAAKPGNCGVLVHASTLRELYELFPKSLEVQMHSGDAGDFWCIGQDIAVPDMVERRGPPETWGVAGDKNRRIVNLTDGSEKPVGQWNTMTIECVGDAIRVWVNGALVNDGAKCTTTKGRIALQAEKSEVEFRKLLLTPIARLSPAP